MNHRSSGGHHPTRPIATITTGYGSPYYNRPHGRILKNQTQTLSTDFAPSKPQKQKGMTGEEKKTKNKGLLGVNIETAAKNYVSELASRVHV